MLIIIYFIFLLHQKQTTSSFFLAKGSMLSWLLYQRLLIMSLLFWMQQNTCRRPTSAFTLYLRFYYSSLSPFFSWNSSWMATRIPIRFFAGQSFMFLRKSRQIVRRVNCLKAQTLVKSIGLNYINIGHKQRQTAEIKLHILSGIIISRRQVGFQGQYLRHDFIIVLLNSWSMRHFRIEEKDGKQAQRQTNHSFQQKLISSLGGLLRNTSFIEFVVNYGYAVENVWVTMLMIVHKTPDLLDSFVWITPIIIAVLLRPHIIRFIHKINLKAYRQINVIVFLLIVGGLGCFVVGLSCQKHKKQHKIRRALICSLGWTLMDVSFELCLYFKEKLKQGYAQLKEKYNSEVLKLQLKEQEDKGQEDPFKYQFYGLITGYIISFLVCIVLGATTVNDFYRCAKYTYYSVGVISMLVGLRLYIQSRLSLPAADLQQKSAVVQSRQVKKKQMAAKKAQKNISFYLPGFYQLQFQDSQTFSLLMIHCCVCFLNDIVVIYTTMWFAQISQPDLKHQGQSLIHGLKMGSAALLIYTIIDYVTLRSKILQNVYLLNTFFLLIVIAAFLAFAEYNHLFIVMFIMLVAVMNHFYRNIILQIEPQHNSLFERCLEIVQRFQKIFVLCLFPFVPLIVLHRDDIVDSLILSSFVSLLAVLIYVMSRLRKSKEVEKEDKITIKINKID